MRKKYKLIIFLFLIGVLLINQQVCFCHKDDEGAFVVSFYDETNQVAVQVDSTSDNGYWVSCIVWIAKEKVYLQPKQGLYNNILTFNLPADADRITIALWQKVYKAGTDPGPDPKNPYAQNPKRTYYFWGELQRDFYQRKCKENWRTKKMECGWDAKLDILP